MDNILFEAKNINKSFGITHALTDVSLTIKKGTIHGLIGENGSGKSTFSSIVVAALKCDSGEMYLENHNYKPTGIYEAASNGVFMVMQEQGTFPNLTVSANLFVGNEKEFIHHGLLNNKDIETEAKKALSNVGASHIKPQTMLSQLSFEDRKLVELARSMYHKPHLLIIDETSTALSRDGRALLYSAMSQVREQQGAVLFITHDIDELADICDEITVLRDGIVVKNFGSRAEFDKSLIKEYMIGRTINEGYYRTDSSPSRSETLALETKDLRYKNIEIDELQVYKGEILGVGGLSGCGMHELGKILYGAIKPDVGSIVANNRKILSVQDAIKNKIAYIAKDRDAESLLKSASIQDNICIVSYDLLAKHGLISPLKEKDFANNYAQKLQIKMQSISQYVTHLSGGNKQKVVLARWLGFDADIYILDCPTRGIDIGVKAAIYSLLCELKAHNKAIIIISEELPELIGMSDRIVILKDGKVNGQFERAGSITEKELINYMV